MPVVVEVLAAWVALSVVAAILWSVVITHLKKKARL